MRDIAHLQVVAWLRRCWHRLSGHPDAHQVQCGYLTMCRSCWAVTDRR